MEVVVLDEFLFDVDSYICVLDVVVLNEWVVKVYKCGWIVVDIEIIGFNEMQVDLVGILFCVEVGEVCYILFIYKKGVSDDFFGSDDLVEGQMGLNEVFDILKLMFEDLVIIKIFQNVKYDCKIFKCYGVLVVLIDDMMLMFYVMNVGEYNYGMDVFSECYFSYNLILIKMLLGMGKFVIIFDKVLFEDVVKYVVEDVDIILCFWQKFKLQLY